MRPVLLATVTSNKPAALVVVVAWLSSTATTWLCLPCPSLNCPLLNVLHSIASILSP